jgi:hypothetical protein
LRRLRKAAHPGHSEICNTTTLPPPPKTVVPVHTMKASALDRGEWSAASPSRLSPGTH